MSQLRLNIIKDTIFYSYHLETKVFKYTSIFLTFSTFELISFLLPKFNKKNKQ